MSNKKKVIIFITLILACMTIYTTFQKTSQEKTTQVVLVENVIATNQNILLERCVEQAKIDSPTLLANQEINLTFKLNGGCWNTQIAKNELENVEKEIRMLIEKYLRNLNNQVTNTTLERNMLGQIYNTYGVKIKVIHPLLEQNTANIEKAVQVIKWEAKWQRKN